MNEDASQRPKEDFEARLRRARGLESDDSGGKAAFPGSAFGAAMRIATELVAALAIGVGIGLGIDYWLGTRPWFLIAFFFVGAAAGFLNVYRAAKGFGAAPGYKPDADETSGPERGKD